MLTQQITDYVNFKKSQGQTRDQIRQELIISGWTTQQADEIDELFLPDQGVSHPAPVSGKSHRPRLPKLLIGSLAALLLFSIAVVLPAYLVAFGKITLPNPQLNSRIKNIVLSLPLVPKTPETLLSLVSENISSNISNDFDFSIAVTLPESLINEFIPSRNFDISVTGFTNYKDVNRPQGEVLIKMNQDFELSMLSTGDTQYLNLKKYPLVMTPILSLFGVDTERFRDGYIDKWFSLDLSQLDTPARSELKALPTPTPSIDTKEIEKKLTDILLQKVLPKTTMSRQNVDGKSVYRMTYSPDADTLDLLILDLSDILASTTLSTAADSITSSNSEEKTSDYIKNLSIEVDILADSYQVSQVKSVFDLILPDNDFSSEPETLKTSANQTIKTVIVAKMFNYNSTKTVTIPSDHRPLQEAFEELLSLSNSGGGFINPSRQFSMANNSKRRSDLNTLFIALSQYAADNQGGYPAGITSTPKDISTSGANICGLLVPEYLAAMPADPASSSGASITDCNTTYNTGYQVSVKQSSGTITLTAPLSELDEVISVNP